MTPPTSRGNPARRRRAKVSVTIDPALLKAVDQYVQQRDGMDRSKVMESALENWYRTRQEEEMIEQFKADDRVPDKEWQAWRKIRRAAAARTFSKRP